MSDGPITEAMVITLLRAKTYEPMMDVRRLINTKEVAETINSWLHPVGDAKDSK